MPRLDLNAVRWSNWSVIDRRTRISVPLALNPPQQYICDRLMDRAARGLPMWAIVLKGRRCGSSTYCEALMTAHCIAFPNARAMTIAHRGKNAKELFETARGFHQHFSRSINADFQSNVHELFFPHVGGYSKHTLATAGTEEGGRSLMLSALLFSEAAFYENAEKLFTGYESTVNRDQGSVLLYESTANGQVGNGEAFYEKWQNAVEGKNDLEPIFISWLMDPMDRGSAIGQPPEEFGRPPYDKRERELMENYGADADQIAFRRWTIENKCQGLEEIFDQEYPTTPETAFITSGDPAFLPGELQAVEASVKHRAKYKSWQGNLEEDREGKITLRETRAGSLKLWERPQRDCKYFIGGDAARGLLSADGAARGDFASAVGINGSTGRQAFTFEARVPISEFAWCLYLLGHWYNRAMLNIEHTGGDGHYATKELRDTYHYPNFMAWRSKDDKRQRGVNDNFHIGWETTYRSRQQMLITLREAVRTGELEIYCPTWRTQLYLVERVNTNFDWEIKRGHDDVFIAGCLAVIAWQQNPPPRIKQNSVNLLDKEETEVISFEPEYGEKLRLIARQIMSNQGPPPQGKGLEGV